jgi:hypothetical protein
MGTFGTKRDAMSWQMRFHKIHVEVISPDPVRLHERFGWMNGERKVEYPKPWIVEEYVNPRRPREEADKEWTEWQRLRSARIVGAEFLGRRYRLEHREERMSEKREKARRDFDVVMAKAPRSNARIVFLRIMVGRRGPLPRPSLRQILHREW